ncbi:hypothetical protein I4F81_001841 [Pyropia yezoensis]|uniref:Uncharacterized protein n=1 Tax=Pyropia yezoensis TaxID=2788 RepID=A0ACC3BMS5_PYRYE|nr:hypothetical protein I4F81_001841 [Neopyropia yezoensis]
MVDRDFQLAAQKASDAGQTETLQFCKRWLGVTTPEEYERYAAEDQVFRDQDLDPLYKTFEYFVFLKRAAEVQHSISFKFRGHLTYMSPASLMAHRIAQLSLMNLTAAFKLTDAAAKAENDGVRLNSYYYNVRVVKCVRTD